MSRGSIDQLDALRYGTEAWKKTKEEMLRRPFHYASQGIIDKKQPQISEIIEKRLRSELMEKIEAVLCDGEYHVVKITRDEGAIPLLQEVFPHEKTEVRVTYEAEIKEVREKIAAFPRLYREPWEREPLPYPSKGRNHRKKDRARARYRKALRKKLREDLHGQAMSQAMHKVIHHARKGRENEQTTSEKGV